MKIIERLGLYALHKMDPERAHNISLRALRSGLVPMSGQYASRRLQCEIAGLRLSNPVGLAAGYDKNAVALRQLANAGFGFIEVGAVTPRAQPGNPRPRLFRLTQDRAVINRFGFNNDGMEKVSEHLLARPSNAVIGLNLGVNKFSRNKVDDFTRVLLHCGSAIDFATINVSSPNTANLRDLQGVEALSELVQTVVEVRDELEEKIPVFLKIAPDLSLGEIDEIANVAVASGIDGIVATNTTTSRDKLVSSLRSEPGGLSGEPLFEKSTRIIAHMAKKTKGQIPLIGVGGISSAEDAYAKILAGASVVQLYTALVYKGLSLVGDIVRGLDALLQKDGYENISDAVGKKADSWI
ncbi:MAG: quinone-dependent dihydroorotate dehydrogenase [Roseovarius sp.]|nr:quinone-dependent dihydroorotate dehydrogenase [Roseovarius sp.]MCY4315652.1 quinone-dependent dihydroorotate dehydrogenase [Roseovarius sp.]